MSHNPYSLTFGKEPVQFISRPTEISVIMDSFLAEESSQQIFMITGVRGSGKTVFMTEVSKKLAEKKDWIVVELNTTRDLLTNFASKLSSEHSLAKIFQKAKINLSFFGFGLEVEGVVPITDIETALGKMLLSLKQHGRRVLITVDEVSNTKTMREFAAAYQIFLRQDLPVYLIMTGLYENINALQNEKNLTFLYRAPKLELKPLNIRTIALNYRKTFSVAEEKAMEMARLTKGYSFAFQVLGYVTWEHDGVFENAQDDYRQYLEDYVYDKIWSELSHFDRKIAYAAACTSTGKILEIRERLGMETNQFNPYRKRLIKKGILNGDVHGYLYFTLPLFDQYVLAQYME